MSEARLLGYAERVGLRIECGNARCRRAFTIGDREDGKVDRRTRFCCAACERQHWRDVTRHPAHAGAGTPMVQFRSVAELASWEKRSAEE